MRRLTLLLSAALVCLAAFAGTANAALLFNGTSLSAFTVEGETGTVTEVTDPLGSGKKVFKNVVTDKNLSPFGNPRAQQRSTALFEKGKDLWFKTKIMVPGSFPKSIPNGDPLLSVSGPPYASAPFVLDTYGETLEWQRNGTYSWDIPWEIPLAREKWISIVVHERFDEGTKGLIEMWVDGEQVTFFKTGVGWNPGKHAETTKVEMATLDASNNEAPNTLRLLQSRTKGDAETATVYFGSLKIGQSREDVSDPTFNGKTIAAFDAVEAAPGAVTEVSDPLGSGETVFSLKVNDKDVYPVTPTENPRAQLLSPDDIEKGDEFWLKTKFLLPSGFPKIPGWLALLAVYGAPYGGPGPWGIEVENEELMLHRNGTYSWDIPWVVPLERGKWTTVLVHERFDEAGKGWIELWINGKKITFFKPATSYNPGKYTETTKLTMATMDASNNEGGNSARIAQYREKGMFETGTSYFGPLRIGDERADVDY
ncbi:MAG: heparin lyase I family protein [Solirubrobacterales bacterium]